MQLEKTTPEAIRAAVEQVLADSAYRRSAAAIAEKFRICSGAKDAADKILAVCEEHQRIYR